MSKVVATRTEMVDGQPRTVKVLAPVSREQSLRQHRLLAPATRREREAKVSDFAKLLAGESTGGSLVGAVRFRIGSE
ncbi:MAG: hypothetical protein GX605_14335, partial [Chloroflexi bacterium]|nr:hypothetical protein [Chloroflexota bacterium]